MSISGDQIGFGVPIGPSVGRDESQAAGLDLTNLQTIKIPTSASLPSSALIDYPITRTPQVGAIFDVHDFGAKGDGVTDDGPAVMAALKAADALGGGIIAFHALPYLIATTITDAALQHSHTFLGVLADDRSNQGTRLFAPSGSIMMNFSTIRAYFRNIQFEGGGTGNNGVLNLISHNALFERCTFTFVSGTNSAFIYFLVNSTLPAVFIACRFTAAGSLQTNTAIVTVYPAIFVACQADSLNTLVAVQVSGSKPQLRFIGGDYTVPQNLSGSSGGLVQLQNGSQVISVGNVWHMSPSSVVFNYLGSTGKFSCSGDILDLQNASPAYYIAANGGGPIDYTGSVMIINANTSGGWPLAAGTGTTILQGFSIGDAATVNFLANTIIPKPASSGATVPNIYQVRFWVALSGGTVTGITANGATLPPTTTLFPVFPGGSYSITWTTAPTITYLIG